MRLFLCVGLLAFALATGHRLSFCSLLWPDPLGTAGISPAPSRTWTVWLDMMIDAADGTALVISASKACPWRLLVAAPEDLLIDLQGGRRVFVADLSPSERSVDRSSLSDRGRYAARQGRHQPSCHRARRSGGQCSARASARTREYWCVSRIRKRCAHSSPFQCGVACPAGAMPFTSTARCIVYALRKEIDHGIRFPI